MYVYIYVGGLKKGSRKGRKGKEGYEGYEG